MNMTTQFNLLKVISKPVLQEVGDTKVLKFVVDANGHKLDTCMFGRYAELTSSYLRKGHELTATGHQIPSKNGKVRFVLDRTFLCGTPLRRVLNNLSMLKADMLERLWPFKQETPEEPVPTEKSLVDMVLEWWEEARYETVPYGDGDCDNLYSEEPDFVTEARKLKEEVIVE
jgi:hypothetical protein